MLLKKLRYQCLTNIVSINGSGSLQILVSCKLFLYACICMDLDAPSSFVFCDGGEVTRCRGPSLVSVLLVILGSSDHVVGVVVMGSANVHPLIALYVLVSSIVGRNPT